jgi:FkbM family methyltransferase
MRTALRATVGRLARLWLRDQDAAQRMAVIALSTTNALARVKARGLEVGTIIDVGASDGRWSLKAREVLPGARAHLVEANPVHRQSLAALCRERPGFSCSLVAAGPVDGEIAFDGSNPGGGRAAPPDGLDHPLLPQRSLASLAREHGLAPPYLIKLDTHGYELPILEGATELFAQTSLMVIEAYTFPLRGSGPRFFELADWLAARGFLAIDLSEPLWRPGDGALWQFDLFFVPATRPEFASVRFR